MRLSQLQYDVQNVLIGMSAYRMYTVYTQPEKTENYFGSLEKIVDSAEDSSEFVETYRDYKRHLDLARQERKERIGNNAKRLVYCSTLSALFGVGGTFFGLDRTRPHVFHRLRDGGCPRERGYANGGSRCTS